MSTDTRRTVAASAVFVLALLWLAMLAVPVRDGGDRPVSIDTLLQLPALAQAERNARNDAEIVTERPLFVASRRPAIAPPVAPPVPEAPRAVEASRPLPPPDGVLTGVLVSSEFRQVLVRRADGTSLRLGEGDKIDGWRVATITADAVTLVDGGRQHSLAFAVHAAEGANRALMAGLAAQPAIPKRRRP